MHELRRRAYLDSMGIDSYVSRTQLPGAATTQRLVIVRQPGSTRAAVANPSSGLAAALSQANSPAPSVDKAKQEKPAIETSQPSIAVARAPTAVPSFSVAAIACGGWLWVEELSNETLSRHQVHLIRAMARALGLGGKQADVSQFDWPIHRNSQLDLGDEAAGAGLHGFMQRKLEQQGCGGLVLLGSACQHRLGVRELDVGRCIRTVGTAEMLLDPTLKKQAWQDLLPILSGS